ncbi:MAG: magnesium transporter [Clostridia bacterium]|nr:magnesium transporter [Clostridia bacterium]MBR3486146.1 magnesium transporter [Clostridia bacterium]
MHEILSLVEERAFSKLRGVLIDMNPADIAEQMTEIEDDKSLVIVFRLLPKEQAAEVFSYLESEEQQRIVTRISDRELAGLVNEMFVDDAVDFTEEMPANIVRRVLALADPDTRKAINQLLKYPDNSAGSLMTTELLRLKGEWNVAEAIAYVRKNCMELESITYAFVTDDSRHLTGVVSMKEVLGSPDEALISSIMDDDVIYAATTEDQADVAEQFKKYDIVSMPVVDGEMRLVGLITIDDVVDVMEDETTEDIYKMAAMAPIEDSYMSTSVFSLAKKRVVWLLVLMISATFTGLIITKFENMLTAVAILTSFIPMLMDTCGNAGSQASVSVIRALVLGEVHFSSMLKVIWKEFRVSIIVGVCVAVVNFIRIIAFYYLGMYQIDAGQNIFLIAGVVSMTLILAVICAKFVGCTLPLLADKAKLDPALMASPMITTIVDAVSLLVYFGIASLVLL